MLVSCQKQMNKNPAILFCVIFWIIVASNRADIAHAVEQLIQQESSNEGKKMKKREHVAPDANDTTDGMKS